MGAAPQLRGFKHAAGWVALPPPGRVAGRLSRSGLFWEEAKVLRRGFMRDSARPAPAQGRTSAQAPRGTMRQAPPPTRWLQE